MPAEQLHRLGLEWMLQHFQMNFGSFAGTALTVLQRVNAVDPTVLSRVRGVCWIVAAAFAGGKWSVSLSRSGVVLRNVRCPIRAERRVTNRRRCRAAAYLPSSLTFTLNSLLPFPAVALALSDLNTLGLAIRRRRRGWTDYKLA